MLAGRRAAGPTGAQGPDRRLAGDQKRRSAGRQRRRAEGRAGELRRVGGQADAVRRAVRRILRRRRGAQPPEPDRREKVRCQDAGCVHHRQPRAARSHRDAHARRRPVHPHQGRRGRRAQRHRSGGGRIRT